MFDIVAYKTKSVSEQTIYMIKPSKWSHLFEWLDMLVYDHRSPSVRCYLQNLLSHSEGKHYFMFSTNW